MGATGEIYLKNITPNPEKRKVEIKKPKQNGCRN
jgi:hypothetical protein